MSTTLSNNIINPLTSNNSNKHPLTLQTKSPSFSNMKPKKPKFQASKPSYLVSGIASKLLLDIDNKTSNQYKQQTFSPINNNNPSNTTPIQKILPHKLNSKEPTNKTEPNLRLKTISVNTTKSAINPNDKRNSTHRKIFNNKNKDTLSLSITHPNSTSFTKDNKHITTTHSHSARKLQTSNSFTSSIHNKKFTSSKPKINNKPHILTSENYVKTHRPNSKQTLTLKNEYHHHYNKSGSNIFSNRSNTHTNGIDLNNGILHSKLLSSPKIQVPPKKIANSPTQIYHPKFNVNIYTPSKTISTKPIIAKHLGKNKSMTAINGSNNGNSSCNKYLSKEKKQTVSKGKGNNKCVLSKPGSPSVVRSNNSSGRYSHNGSGSGTTVYIEADKVKQKFKKKVQNEIAKRKYSNHKIAIREDINEIGLVKKEEMNINTNHNNNNNQIELRVLKIDSCTMAGFSEPNVQKINQDNFFIEKNFFNKPEQFFVGVW